MKTLAAILILAGSMTAQTNAYAYGYFYAPDGQLALVNIVRTQDATTKLITTELFYTFCGQANLGTACQRGDGIIPNSATTGGVYTNINAPDIFSVQVDTFAVAGYKNEICTQGIDDYADCLGSVPATGGLISIAWTRTNEWANIETSSGKSYKLGKLVFSGSSLLETFSANQTGTVLGVSATSGATMVTSSNSQTLQAQFALRKTRNR